MEPYTKEFTLTDAFVDCFGKLKLSSLLYFAQEIAGEHFDRIAMDYDTLAQKNLFWAIIRTRVQIQRLPCRGEKIRLVTWPMPTTRVAYPRAMTAYDSDGNVLYRTLSVWVLMDISTRTMVLPGKSGISVDGIVMGDELDVPGSIASGHHEHQASQQVTYSLLDRNGHMNNTHYLTWASDLLPSSFHKENTCREFTICYFAEALEGQQINLSYSPCEDGLFRIDAHRRKTNDDASQERVFSVQMRF